MALRDILMRDMYRLWVVAGLVAFSCRPFALTIKRERFFVVFTPFFLPRQAKRAAYAARGANRPLVYIVCTIYILYLYYIHIRTT